MDFFNSLSEIAKNNKNFKVWEEKQADTQAQREELYQRRKYSKQEIEHAKQLGNRIVDVVDIMDNHSESVAENVETATQPLVGLAPILTTAPAAIYYWKKILTPNEKTLSDIEDKLFENKEARDLAEEISEEIHKVRPMKRGFYSWDFTSKNRINKIKNPKLKARAMEICNQYIQNAKTPLRKIKGGIAGVIATYILTFVGANIYAAKLQVDSSKIARWQARQMLEDPKAFVNYTPEQIEAAKKYIEDHPELKKQKKKEKLNTGLFKSIINIIKDRKAYKQAKLNDSDDSKKVSRPLTQEELIQAKKDQEVIQRSIRIINNEAEKYSENMEVAAGIILGSTPIVGGFMGWLTGLIMNKTKLTDKIVSNTVNQYGSDDAKAAFAKFKEIKEGGPGYTLQWKKFAEKFLDDNTTPQKIETEISKAKPAKRKITTTIKKIFAVGMAHKWGNTKIIGLLAAFLSSIPAALIALKLQKSASRAGRFTAKRELEQEPKNFIGYTEEDFEEVKDVKGKKQTFGQKVKEYALFVPNVLKQYYAYEKYKRTEFKENQLLLDELQKSEVSEEQLRDAKNLQRKLFNTFEKVDDSSQTYSESMEAATEIVQPFAFSAGLLVMVSPLIYTGVQVYKGKLTAAQLINKITKKLSNASSLLKSKFFKKYLEDVSNNIPHKVANGEIDDKLREIMNSSWYKEMDNPIAKEKITEALKNLQDLPSSLIRVFKNSVKDMPDEEFYAIFDKLGLSSMDKKTMLEILPNIEKIVDNIPKEEMTKLLTSITTEFMKKPEEFMRALEKGEIAKAFITDSVKKAFVAAGITWTALNVIFIWIVQTWLADLQLKAGRLGVMKAMESLKDPTYYANIEPLKNNPQAQESKTNSTQPEYANMLDKLKKKNKLV